MKLDKQLRVMKLVFAVCMYGQFAYAGKIDFNEIIDDSINARKNLETNLRKVAEPENYELAQEGEQLRQKRSPRAYNPQDRGIAENAVTPSGN